MPEENWINYVSRKELMLLEDAAADLKFEQYELVNNMRRHSPSPMKLWIEFSKDYGDWFVDAIPVGEEFANSYCINGIALIPTQEMVILERRLKAGKLGIDLLDELKILPEGRQETILNIVSRELNDETPDTLENPQHSGIVRLKWFKPFSGPSSKNSLQDIRENRPGFDPWMEQVKLMLSYIDVESLKTSNLGEKSDSVRCILWTDEQNKLELLAKLLADQGYIDNPSVWLNHFSTEPLKLSEEPPIHWKKNKYELHYLLRNLQNYVIRESHPIHFKGLKPPPWSGNKPTHKLKTIEAITKQVN